MNAIDYLDENLWRGKTYYQIITAAVADLTEFGFDSAKRVEIWTERIRKVAKASMVPTSTLERNLRQALTTNYTKLVTNGGVLKNHKGIPRYTLDKVKPELRAELDRRIMASASLIKLNRDRAVDHTLQRFVGWATSIPPEGVPAEKRQEIKATIAKSIKQLPFEERRVIIDQSHKLTSAINNIVATNGGAIAAEWISHVGEVGYDYRPSHAARNRKVYALRDGWAYERGLINKGAGFTDEITQPAQEVNCFPGESRIDLFDDASKVYRRIYDGEIIEITLSSGRTITATPNHPILTRDGWVCAGEINKGDNLAHIPQKVLNVPELHNDKAITSFMDIFSSASSVGSHEIRKGMTPDFHGDGTAENIDIISLTGILGGCINSSGRQGGNNFFLPFADFLRSGVGSVKECAHSLLFSANSSLSATSGFLSVSVRNFTSRLPNVVGDCVDRYSKLLSKKIGVLTGFIHLPDSIRIKENSSLLCEGFSKIDATDLVPMGDGGDRNSYFLGNNTDGSATFSEFVDVVDINRRHFSGHVYNLETSSGWYVSEGVIVSNCRCYYKYFYNLRDLPPEMLTEKGREMLAEVRRQLET